MAKEITDESRESKQKKDKKAKKDKADKAIKKELDNDLVTALEDAEDHETRVELLLTQIVRNTAK